MACGAPVVASDVTSIPEVVGDAGLLCAPRDVEAFATALRRVLDEPGLGGSFNAASRGRHLFDWEATESRTQRWRSAKQST